MAVPYAQIRVHRYVSGWCRAARNRLLLVPPSGRPGPGTGSAAAAARGSAK